MTILASLARAYERLPDAPPFGYSSEKIGFVLSLNGDGTVAQFIDWREGEGKKARPRSVDVPASFKRPGITPRAFFLWDNSAYVLGVSGDDTKDCSARHAAFKDYHRRALAETSDPGLVAVRVFLNQWEPTQFLLPQWSVELKDQNIIFALESERQIWFIHQRPEALTLWFRISMSDASDLQICLVTGEKAPVARLHQAIKGVWGGQVAGGSLVSFNLDAFTSYGHEQGDNAPVSEAASFAYTTALNRFLDRDSGHRIQIADASTVFWADAQDMEKANLAEAIFGFLFEADAVAGEDLKAEENASTRKIGVTLEKIRQGLPLDDVEPELAKGVRFYVLGLAPNAARLSVRFYFEDDFSQLTENYQKFVADMRIEPPPRGGTPPLWRYLQETAVLGKRENITPNLAGEWMRAILTGNRFPLSLMSSVLTRLRADGEVNALRAGILKAVLIRNFNREAPVALDPENTNKGYLLGRLFATYEHIQTAALGAKVNATIKDKFYGSASAQPRKVFRALDSGSGNHLSKIGKQKPGYKVVLEKHVSAIMEMMAPGNDPFPASLAAEEQALFGLGYYHQRNELFKKTTVPTSEGEPA